MWLEYRVKGVTKALQVFYFLFLGLYLQHMEVPGLGSQIGAAAASLSHSFGQYQILNPRREARDQTCILMDTMSGS